MHVAYHLVHRNKLSSRVWIEIVIKFHYLWEKKSCPSLSAQGTHTHTRERGRWKTRIRTRIYIPRDNIVVRYRHDASSSFHVAPKTQKQKTKFVALRLRLSPFVACGLQRPYFPQFNPIPSSFPPPHPFAFNFKFRPFIKDDIVTRRVLLIFYLFRN